MLLVQITTVSTTTMAGKEFKLRNEPLAEKLQKNEDFKQLYNLCAVIITTFLIDTIIRDYAQSNRYQFGFRLILVGYNKFHIVILIWCMLNILALVCFFCFSLWATIRVSLTPKTSKFWDQTWLLLLIIYYILSLYGIQTVVKFFEFKILSALLLSIEQVRLVMKQHAFVRTNAAKVLIFKIHNDRDFSLPNFQKYLYFLFAPTLIYRDNYPRTTNIRWRIILYRCFGLIYILWFLSMCFDILMVPYVENVCIKKITVAKAISLVLGNGFLGAIVGLSVFYVTFHSIQPIFAELLRFGDRVYYQDWWTSKTSIEFARKWNSLVQDWLYFYVFKDVYLLSKNNLFSKVVLLAISAITHEWILMISLNLFLPVISMMYLTVIIFKMLTDPLSLLGNNFVTLLFGAHVIGIHVSLYALEYYARQNCPLDSNGSYFDFFKPRLITCDCII